MTPKIPIPWSMLKYMFIVHQPPQIPESPSSRIPANMAATLARQAGDSRTRMPLFGTMTPSIVSRQRKAGVHVWTKQGRPSKNPIFPPPSPPYPCILQKGGTAHAVPPYSFILTSVRLFCGEFEFHGAIVGI